MGCRLTPTRPTTSCSAARWQAPAVIARVGTGLPYSGYSTSNTLLNALRPFPQFSTIAVQNSPTGKTWYDSLQMKATKRMSHGLQVNGTFTWSKAMTEIRPNLFVPSNKSLEPTDQPFLLNANILYVTQGWFSNKMVATAVKDWKIGAFLQYGSGLPLTPPAATTTNFIGGSEQFRVPGQPLFIKNLNCGCINPYQDLVLNPAAWVNPPNGTFGPATGTMYGDFRSARRPTESANFGRTFRFKENRFGLEIRGEFTNIFNRTQIGNPITTAPGSLPTKNNLGQYTAGFGVINLTVSGPNQAPTYTQNAVVGQLYSLPRNGALDRTLYVLSLIGCARPYSGASFGRVLGRRDTVGANTGSAPQTPDPSCTCSRRRGIIRAGKSGGPMRHVTRHITAALVGLALTAGIVYTAESDAFTPSQRSFWAFQPVKKSPVPAVKNGQWAKTPVDSFVLAKLEEAGLQPNPPADRLTLLRRATIDMTGLPPTQEEIHQFLSDQSPNAWEKVVDRLLASPAYGERWARHWLDVARYADSNGFKADETRPNIWRYRDYVIDAFNSDKPYDRFVKEQIAGDELYPGDPDALVAMGFNRNWIDETNAAALFTRRQETLDDMTTATGEAFLGLTFGCARCHNHKFDPILQKDYYRLQAFFSNTSFGDGPLPVKDPARARSTTSRRPLRRKDQRHSRRDDQILEPLRAAKAKSGSNTFEEEKRHWRSAAKRTIEAVPLTRYTWLAPVSSR